jgi:hypothetical protein
MQQPTRYYITKSGEEPTVRSVRVEQPAVIAAPDDARRVQIAESNAVVESGEQRRTVKDLVQVAIQKRHFFS